ncbi:hypothetical protein HCC61_24320 [Streptomyces sp. HNM0575]|uniref:hypothetical protein n=1 Tax=Streptomyces sp. HNM0575 TaxID=2716338 RepID=UPI00145D1B77|nr:hypothetical protein [Streptomyces sp. HNM0575]NLU75739.1 hypothetical protein [Streptomyces sp. HNM0575]
MQPAGSPPADRPLGAGLAVATVVLGLPACALPLLPVNLDRLRQYVAFPPTVGGLVLAPALVAFMVAGNAT